MTEQVRTRATVERKDFLRVAIVERDQYNSHDKAAKALGMTADSFKQRYYREKKEYPAAFNGVPDYPRGKESQDDVLKMLKELREAAKASKPETEGGEEIASS